MTNVTPVLSEELEKLLDRTLNDFMNTLLNLSGNQMGISVGTLIKIPMDAGYVKLFKSADSLKMSLDLERVLDRQDDNLKDQSDPEPRELDDK